WADEADYLRLDRYYTELVIEDDSRWTGQPMAGLNRYYDGRLEVDEWMRAGVPQLNKGKESGLADGDDLYYKTAPDEIAAADSDPGVSLHAVKKYGDTGGKADRGTHQLVQVVVAPHSPFIGETIGSVDFRKSFDVLVVGLWRRQEWIRDKLSQVRMRE